MDLTPFWHVWPIAGPWHIEPLTGGTNNLVWHVSTADGERYVLHVFPDLTHLPRLRSHVALLRALSHVDLPFRVSLPVATHSGESIATLSQESEVLALATLSPYLSGEHPNGNDPVLAHVAGSALAVLDNALFALPQSATPEEPSFSYERLIRGDASLPDPLAAVERLPIKRSKVRQIQRIFTEVAEQVADVYTRLPQQLLHRDYDPSNILLADRRVTAVLDFEFADRDVRVMELCYALSQWPESLMGTGKEWEVIDAFSTAYVAGFPLSEEELCSIPSVMRLREVGSLIYRMQRYVAGLSTDVAMQEQANHLLWREVWLAAHRETLLQHARSWR